MQLCPCHVFLRICSEGHTARLCCPSFRALLVTLHHRTPSRFGMGSCATLVVDPNRLALEWSHLLLMNVARTAREARRPHSRLVAEDTPRYGILLPPTPRPRFSSFSHQDFLRFSPGPRRLAAAALRRPRRASRWRA